MPYGTSQWRKVVKIVEWTSGKKLILEITWWIAKENKKICELDITDQSHDPVYINAKRKNKEEPPQNNYLFEEGELKML